VPAGTKLEDQNFPLAEIEAAGYQAPSSARRPTTASPCSPAPICRRRLFGNPHFPDEQKRLIAGTVGDTRVICAYMPNGQAVGSDKYDYKLRWLDALAVWLGGTGQIPEAGALRRLQHRPDDRDVHDPQAWAGQILCSDPERAPSSASSPRPERQLPAVRAAGKDLLVVGLPDARLPEEPRPAHRPCAAFSRRWPANAAQPPASTARRASWSGRRTTRRCGRRRLKRDAAAVDRQKLLSLYPALSRPAARAACCTPAPQAVMACRQAPRSLPNTSPARGFPCCSPAASRWSSWPPAAAN
jgi:hypothetical protein